MLAERKLDQITAAEKVWILRVFVIGLLLRLALALVFEFTNLEQSLNLTKDASLYDRVGKKLAKYYQSDGETTWPGRVSGFVDHLYEHIVGITYYLTDDSVLAVRVINILCGSLVILVTWRMARYVTDADTALWAGIGVCFFPTMIYYSCLPVRDAQSALAMALVFLGMTAFSASGKRRHIMALPLGLVLMTGYRSYVSIALFILLPASWVLTPLVSRSKQNAQRARNHMLVAVLAAVVITPVAVAMLSSTPKAQKLINVRSWNQIRQQLNSGKGALYDADAVPHLGESAIDTFQGVVVGFYFFFLSINPTEMSSIRQWIALPEVLIVLFMFPSLFRGGCRVMRHHRFEFVSVLFVVAAITLAYSCVTTNAGPLMRWRLQVINVYIVVATIGFGKIPIAEKNEGALSIDTVGTN